ncbi:DNA mismatch repair endonuclease MutL [Calothrix sp. 336/3]|uniref:DNA mismatch repair endonuclease MutL n=1 Tax=Calothrix sp. 336/3 TaxID=1337936 RepID=UPI0004E34E4D|nr:DNA mismatch repair endonuclease MutL [Calothrix sp. 336/3]AKG22468.1 DNA mismatch repair protein MutL [Calothrix sp. 336/3]
MVATIQVLPTEVVYLITAGEVIDSFASVVRELVENSLDAGATRIVVTVSPQNWQVRVTDNGRGMDIDDLHFAAKAHSTSKIRNSDDLWKITSLGFRGEALHSLTTLADVEICSRSHLGDIGWRVIYGYGGEALHVEATAIAPGTIVTVSNLFGNCTARRQGLPTFSQQMKAVQATIQQIALCHPHIAWQVWQDDRQWFTISPTTTMGKLLPQMLQQIRPGDLQELELQLSHPAPSSLYLAVGLPDRCHRHRPDWLRVAMNGRIIKSTEIEQTILGAFHRTLPRDRFPVCCLHLHLSPEQINWNRNPAKNEIYLNNLSQWQEQITQGINQALNLNSDTIPETVQTTRVSKLIKAAESTGNYQANSAPHNQNFLKAVAQINNTYIVAEHPGGMWLVEQHIAHERVLYEQLCDNWQIIPVEPPIILYQLQPRQITQLQTIGLDIETFGEQMWAIRTIPTILQSRSDIADAILELSLGGDLQTAQVAVACRSAIRNGTPLTLEEMQKILDDWQRTRNPHTCPHGRPIFLSLEEPNLARFFRRHWVIGKSHGI